MIVCFGMVGMGSATNFQFNAGAYSANSSYTYGSKFVCTLSPCTFVSMSRYSTGDCNTWYIVRVSDNAVIGSGVAVNFTATLNQTLVPYVQYWLVWWKWWTDSPWCTVSRYSSDVYSFGLMTWYIQAPWTKRTFWGWRSNLSNVETLWATVVISWEVYWPPPPAPNIYYNWILNTWFAGTNIYLYWNYVFSLSGADYIYTAQTYRTLLRYHP